MKTITRQNLEQWLGDTCLKMDLAAPKKVDDVLLYSKVRSIDEIEWEYSRPVMSAKQYFFPSTERILTIEKVGQDIKLIENIPENEMILFGLRPCDAKGIASMDALFINNNPSDEYYESRRKHAVIIGVACNKIGESCFCTSTGGAPDDSTGMDIILKEFDGNYTVEMITEKGRKIGNEEWDLTEVEDSQIPYIPVSMESQFILPDVEHLQREFDNHFWEDTAERCLSCRICAYVCPTCRCFDVRDEPIFSDNGNDKFERIRCWDSCAGEAYRQIAGGHNPRSSKGQRLRNRFLCKFYYFQDQNNTVACTGCGRCIDSCPVNIDITEVMSQFALEANEMQ